MAASNAVMTAGGASVTFGTSAVTIPWHTIGQLSATRAAVSKTDLADTKEAMIPGDTVDDGAVTISGWSQPTDYKLLYDAMVTGTPETFTCTNNKTTATTAKLETSTTAFITDVTQGQQVVNEMIEISVTVNWGEGKTVTDET